MTPRDAAPGDLPETLAIDDPRALRAVAHPVRMQVLSVLYAGEVLTATEAAQRCGVTPSAMSYHLRLLERWGIVRRAAPGSDGRERPWQATARTVDLSPAGRGAPASFEPLVGSLVQEIQRAVSAALRSPDSASLSMTMRRGVTRLTAEQADRMNQEIRDIMDSYDDLAEPGDEGARQWDVFYLSVPQPGSGQEAD